MIRTLTQSAQNSLQAKESQNSGQKKPRQKGRGLNWYIAKGIEVWGLPVMRRDVPGTVNLQI